MMGLLLKFEGYPPAVLLTVFLHGALVWFFLDHDLAPSNLVKIEPASIAVATTKQSPQRLRRLEQLEMESAAQKRARDKAAKEAADKVARERANAQAEAQKQAEIKRQADAKRIADQQRKDAETKRLEEERQTANRRAAEAERQRVADLQRQRDAQAAEEQRRAAANSQNQQAENDIVSQYTGIIYGLISRNWNIPPGARNEMSALVEIKTTPFGDITSYTVITSSGNAAFDRSVLQAVARVGDLPELQDLPNAVYERNFRTFQLLFKPEDLLR